MRGMRSGRRASARRSIDMSISALALQLTQLSQRGGADRTAARAYGEAALLHFQPRLGRLRRPQFQPRRCAPDG
ncbi:hypothetical protein NC00_03765 [Xanthomonas cannabis pv. phaseoli]|uniref:Uncharacterized protein n=1 Tax=Xanthomonas cannabis pv. phaseoli TaxID=1885902 RepID=A0AB34PBY9_9XANT|nr:hypothetical protein NC00_03765 [Xanthomonas cannabis pv. phaseoli]